MPTRDEEIARHLREAPASGELANDEGSDRLSEFEQKIALRLAALRIHGAP